ncbi:MAG: hypothetical protein JKY65_30460 [Planctomycetes bacterium]|nr:hypothetical protein [Planctomycetota bacterium]
MPGLHPDSVLGGAFGSLLCVGSAFVLPAFRAMFEETGVRLPASTELLVGVPDWAWWVLGALSIVLMSLKDRWLNHSLRNRLNGLYAALVVGAGLSAVTSLLLPLAGGGLMEKL